MTVTKGDDRSNGYGFQKGQWEFDASVVANWDREVTGHIPDYWKLLPKFAEVVDRIHGTDASVLFYNTGPGNHLDPYVERGWRTDRLHATQYQQPVLDAFVKRFPSVNVQLVDQASRPFLPTKLDREFDVVSIHWAMHFEPPDTRPTLISDA